MDDYQVLIKDSVLIVKPPEELAYDVAPRLKAEVEAVLQAEDVAQQVSEVQVELNKTTFMDSTGISVLVLIQKEASQAGIAVRLIKPRQEVVKILKLVGLINFFQIQE
ncbi:MAG: anti-sigma factor antagonist [Desulfovibrio sp.]|nr:MAG: anti-sigma factor antagonist [Desulfovibrio sp.]